MVQKNIKIILGETASGKTQYIENLYTNSKKEIINCDSRKIYKKLNIGTAKPLPETLKKVKHHLIDIVEIDETYNVGDFIRNVKELISKDVEYIVSAGTPFYLDILINGISFIPSIDMNIRKMVIEDTDKRGIESMYEELMKVDKKRANELKQRDTQRILRAIEVYRQTGIPISEYYKTKEKIDFNIKSIIYLKREKEELRKRVKDRTEKMIKNGLIEETEKMISLYGKQTLMDKKIIGYSEIIDHI
ncbi:tRNA (adenosine(37)-N6)-dimethylallyltransferase MiaA, partial [candidate division WOR-3 bacterium]|nr:tRNA (adenosine(37)-N6)-dimethylallyltransferase MiaA [candidate division WOR-3 bacterium]